MIEMNDIIALSGLSEDEINAIAEHEHLPSVNAAALAHYMMEQHNGSAQVHDMICDDIRAALHKHDLAHAKDLYATLKQFLEEHPEAVHNVHK